MINSEERELSKHASFHCRLHTAYKRKLAPGLRARLQIDHMVLMLYNNSSLE